jgi:hypothetical protein
MDDRVYSPDPSNIRVVRTKATGIVQSFALHFLAAQHSTEIGSNQFNIKEWSRTCAQMGRRRQNRRRMILSRGFIRPNSIAAKMTLASMG